MHIVTIPFIASFLAACNNLCLRKNASNDATRYLFVYYLASFLFSLPISYEIFTAPFEGISALLGALVGLCNAGLLYLTTKALSCGSSGMTFAFQNTSYLLPAVLLFFLFGEDFGFGLSVNHGIAIVLVLFGLFLGAKRGSNSDSSRWLQYLFASVAVQIIALTIIQGRTIFTTVGDADCWFMPAQFATSTLITLVAMLAQGGTLKGSEIRYGFLGGILNSIATCLLLFATKIALPLEQAMIFPCFSVGVILFCNLWAKTFYKERFHLVAHSLSIAGVLVAAIAG